MGRVRAVTNTATHPKSRPALNPEARESQMIGLAVDLAERQLIEGTASSQVITHFLKLATQKERLEREILEKQRSLLEAKTKSIESAQRSEEIYNKALKAFRSYSGQEDSDDEYDV